LYTGRVPVIRIKFHLLSVSITSGYGRCRHFEKYGLRWPDIKK
jgi:hypothetical protein